MRKIKRLYLLLLMALTASIAMAGKHIIKSVEQVTVHCPEGNAPRLPWQVQVTYKDGKKEWRQVRWTNSALAIEQMEADAIKTPAGTRYKVRGYILGDNTTSTGFPIDAEVMVTTTPWDIPTSKPKAEPLPLSDVRLTGNNLLTSNRDLDIKALLALDVTQQLYNYRDTYGLPTQGYKQSDGWDSPTTKLKGHGTGHYLSALAFAFAATEDASIKDELRKRMKRMVTEMRECQERTFVFDDSLGRYREARDLAPENELKLLKGTWKAFDEYKKDWEHYGYGYLNAIPAQHAVLIEAYRPYNNEEWVWAPYYSIHKQLAGLIDIAHNIDDKDIADTALLIAKDMGLWVWNRLHYRTHSDSNGSRKSPGNRFEMWNMYIAGEVGGMAESLSRLAEMTANGDESKRLAEAATYFDAPAFFNPIMHNIDNIRTRHANQHIPMIIGALRSYRNNGNGNYYNLATNFWEMIMGRYVYAMGGVGNGEMWRQPYTQMVSMNTNAMTGRNGQRIPNPDLNETCCAYNLAKLTKDLNCYSPNDARLMDYYERVLYNQIVGSVNPDHYAVTYQYAVGLNARKPFGNATPQESCCGGTGAENHVKYQEAAYFTGNDTLWVGLYLPTSALWREKNVRLEQTCEWPAEKSQIKIASTGDAASATFNIKLRVPYWATEGFEVIVNGESIARKCRPCSYIETGIREWKENDRIDIVMPFTKHINYGADKMDIALTTDNGGLNKSFSSQWLGTLMYGPLVMTSPDIHSWEDASLSLSADLSDVEAKKGENGYTMLVHGKHFIADYASTSNSTHYLRLDIPSGSNKKGFADVADTTQLSQLIMVVRERVNGSPSLWAPHGLKRLATKLQEAEALISSIGKKKMSKEGLMSLSRVSSDLNVAIVSMRPGNLAEPEDLKELIELTQEAKSQDMTPARREAIRYAEMVIQYVNDGSGTADMIRKAIGGLVKVREVRG